MFLASGIRLTIVSGLGLSPWGVFHNGLSNQFNLPFGTLVIIVGFVILALSMIFLKSKIGVGTILNIALVGNMINFLEFNVSIEPSNLFMSIVFFVIGIIFMTFGRSFYISSKLGPGPRDGVFVGLSRVTKIDVKYVKPAVEFTVLLIGYILGGVVGWGTVIAIILTSRLVHLFLRLLRFDSKSEHQHNIFEYFSWQTI